MLWHMEEFSSFADFVLGCFWCFFGGVFLGPQKITYDQTLQKHPPKMQKQKKNKSNKSNSQVLASFFFKIKTHSKNSLSKIYASYRIPLLLNYLRMFQYNFWTL